ncbi:MAG: ATP-binding protein, partial [Anaerolineae bacterium]|nr:ATP-binding protein [Caldilineales bacterium]MDW8268244.1 ATP-binding protein [Anaerolineae bacterium]
EGESEAMERPLPALLGSYATSLNVRVTLLSPDLRVLYSSDPMVTSEYEHPHVELLAARVGREQHDIRWDEWRQEERLFVAAPALNEDGEAEAIVQLSMPMAPLYAEIRQTWLLLGSVSLAVLLATVLVSVLLARQMAGPILRLTRMTEAMADGQLDQNVVPEGPDEIARLGRAFNHMAEQVRETLARQQAFVANAAHELRSPLASLLLRVEMLQQHGTDNPELRDRYLRQIRQEITALGSLVEHLLMLSRLDEGRVPAAQPLDLAPLLYELTDEMGALIEAAHLSLQVEVPPHLPAVAANPESIRSAVRNLLDNAIKYTPAGGTVTLAAWAEPATSPARPPTSSRRSRSLENTIGPTVVIQVRDTGQGIPPEHLPHIFERFYRVETTRSQHPGGAGLGLSLVQAIVTAYGGWITAQSEPGRGSAFTLYLPVIA